MNKPGIDFLQSHWVLVAIFWLMAARCEGRAETTNSFPQPLLPAELSILDQLTNQTVIDLATNEAGPTTLANRVIRGFFFERLLTTQGAQLGRKGLRLKNAVIGAVDLSNQEVPVPVELSSCHFTSAVVLAGAHFAHDLSLTGCVFDGEFNAVGLILDGSLKLATLSTQRSWNTGSTARPADAELINYFPTNKNWLAVSAAQTNFVADPDHLTRSWTILDPRAFGQTKVWTNRFKLTAWGDNLFLVQRNDDEPAAGSGSPMHWTLGPLTNNWKLRGATGDLDLDFLREQLATALRTNVEFIREFVLTTNATTTFRSVRWMLDHPADPNAPPLVAFWAGRTNVSFLQPTVFRSSVNLARAKIGGDVNAEGVEFRNTIWCHSLQVGNTMVVSDSRFNDAAGFIYAEVTHDFWLRNCWFKRSFTALGMKSGGSVILEETRFGDSGDFDVMTVAIDLRGPFMRFENKEKMAKFQGLKVEGMVDFSQAQFAGPANFILAQIKGNFLATGTTFGDNHSFKQLQHLTSDSFTFNTDFGSMKVDGFAIFEDVLFARSVSFRNAHFANLYLDGTHWPTPALLLNYTNDPGTNDLLRLEGMDFDTIRDVTSGHFVHTHAQLEESETNLLDMFANRSPYSFDIYAKLESYFQREGAPVLADDVFINGKQRERQEVTGLPAKALNLFLDLTVGYGRKPLLAFCESAVLILIWGLMSSHCMVKKSAPKKSPGFGLALFFSLSTFLPIIELGAADLVELKRGKEWFHYLIALEKILGYILVPLWTMALTGLLK